MNQKRIDIIVSIILAILLWFYVINIANPPVQTTFRDQPVTINGSEALAEKGLAPVTTEGYTVNVTVSGPRNVVNKLKAEDIVLSADISALPAGGGTAAVNASLPSGITLVDMQTPGVEVVVDELVTVSKPVEVVLSGSSSGKEATVLSSRLTQVEVSGAESLVAQVASVRVSGDLSGAEVDKAMDLMLAATPVDETGKVVTGVKLAHDVIGVSAVMYQTKTVPLDVPVEGRIWEGAVLKDTVIGKAIVIKGPASRLSQISGITSKPIDIEGIYETTTYEVEPVLPAGVFEADSSEPVQARFEIDTSGQLTFKFKASEVTVKNIGEGHTADVELGEGVSEISARVTGPVTTLRTLASGDIAPMADAEGRAEGDVTMTLRPSQTIDGLTVEYTPASITLKIK
ncbi:MAG: hypothetical protein J5535_05785 [Firmicutes bacterium]|nr:hypothetical protein [Bacillota bacterium]